MSAVVGGETGEGVRGPWLTLFFQGISGGPNLRVYFYHIASACMHLKLNRPTIEIKIQERA